MGKSSKQVEVRSVTMAGCNIPIHCFYERRNNVRVAQGRNAVLLRIPRHCNLQQRKQYHDWCDDWIRGQWDRNPRFRASFRPFRLDAVELIRTRDQTFNIHTTFCSNLTASSQIRNGTVFLKFPDAWSDDALNKSAYQLIHRALARHYQSCFEEWVQLLHNRQFQKEVASVRVRNMTSKWGSCSHDGKLSFSTRLLFAPVEVQHYVIIHELCHLDVLNHSPAYWQRIASIDPDYKSKESWLRTNGHLCDLALSQEI